MAISVLQVKRIVSFLLERAKVKYDQVVFSFVSRTEIKKLHAISHGDPTFTDCITFPYDSPGEGGFTFLGEAFICPEAAVEFCKENGGDVHTEITLYIVHTLLHMLGYDDIEPKDRTRMRQAERRWMNALSEANLALIQHEAG